MSTPEQQINLGHNEVTNSKLALGFSIASECPFIFEVHHGRKVVCRCIEVD